MIVGITGHQNLMIYDLNWIKTSLKSFIFNNNVVKGLSSLAIGADQLFAETLLEKGVPYEVIIPCTGYEATFKESNDLSKFKALCMHSIRIQQLAHTRPTEEAFYDAGKQIAQQCECLIAIWNAEKAIGLGGTGDIVKYALDLGRRTFHINPIEQTSKFI